MWNYGFRYKVIYRQLTCINILTSFFSNNTHYMYDDATEPSPVFQT